LEASTTLTPKPQNDNIKEKLRPRSLMNINAMFLNKIFGNKIQEYIKIIH
jgi:hypothetical protein